MSKIEMGKTYTTRNGREVRLVGVESAWAFGFVGTMRPCVWNAETGRASDRFDDLGGRDTDLVEVKPTITRTVWLVHFKEHSTPLAYFEKPDFEGNPYAVAALTGPHTITFTPGEGL